MEKQTSNEPVQGSKNIWTAIIAAIITAIIVSIIVGFGIYFWQKSVFEITEQNLQRQISSLQKQADQNKSNNTVYSGTTEEIDDRILLTTSTLIKYTPNCDIEFNSDPANTNIEYINTDWGISVKLPYNQNWGNSKFKINVFDEAFGKQGQLAFGPIVTLEDCGWVQSYTLILAQARTAEEVIFSLGEKSNPLKMKINDLTVIKHPSTGLCPNYPAMQVIGKKYNYIFVPTCGTDYEEEEVYEFLKNIVKTVELIN